MNFDENAHLLGALFQNILQLRNATATLRRRGNVVTPEDNQFFDPGKGNGIVNEYGRLEADED
jgi:hypothetical protein